MCARLLPIVVSRACLEPDSSFFLSDSEGKRVLSSCCASLPSWHLPASPNPQLVTFVPGIGDNVMLDLSVSPEHAWHSYRNVSRASAKSQERRVMTHLMPLMLRRSHGRIFMLCKKVCCAKTTSKALKDLYELSPLLPPV